jgi:transcriptional regulator with XRE-family HTH domain
MRREPGVVVERIQNEMNRRGLKPGQVAEHSGIAYDTLYKLLNTNRPRPSAETVTRLAIAFGCSVEYLMGITDRREPVTLDLDDFSEELLDLSRKLSSRRQRDLLIIARAYLEESKRAASDPSRMMEDLLSLTREYDGQVTLKCLLKLVEQMSSTDDDTPFLGEDAQQPSDGNG